MPEKQLIASRRYYQGKNKFKKNFYFCLTIIFFLVGLIIFIFQTDYFKIKKISISIISPNQINFIKKSEIRKIVEEQIKRPSNFLPKNNIFIFSKNKLKNKFSKDPRIERIEVFKKFPDQLKILVIENKIAALLVVQGGGEYFLNDKGEIIQVLKRDFATQTLPSQKSRENYEKLLKNIPLIYDQTTTNYQKLESKENLLFALRLTKINFLDNIYFKTIKIVKKQGVITIEAISNRNWVAYFLPFTDPEIKNTFESQVKNLELALQKIGNKKIKYIDLRFGDYLYYQ